MTAGEWDNVASEGEWQILRRPATAVDEHGWAFRAMWDDAAMYVLLTTDYDGWVTGLGSDAEEEDCVGALNCGGSDFNGNPDSLNLYFDPDPDDEPNENPPDGYQFAFGLNEGLSSYKDGLYTNTFIFQEVACRHELGERWRIR